MMKRFLLLAVLFLAGVNCFAMEFPEVDIFEAYLYKDYSGLAGDWALAFYNTNDENIKFKYEIDIVSGNNNKLGGNYVVNADTSFVGTCFVEIELDEEYYIFNQGTVSVTWVKTEDGIPYYRIVADITDYCGDNIVFDKTLPCNYSLNKFYYDLDLSCDVTLYDDPAAEEASKPKPATGEVKELTFDTYIRWEDNTANAMKYWQIEGYTYEGDYLLDLSPETTDHVAGKYDWSEFAPEYSRLVHYPGTDDHEFINFQSGTVDVTEDGDYVYVVGDLLGYDGIEYKFNISTDTTVGIQTVQGNSEVKDGSRKILTDKGLVIERAGKTYGLDGRCR